MSVFHLIFSHPILLRRRVLERLSGHLMASQDGATTAQRTQLCVGELRSHAVAVATNTQHCTAHTHPEMKRCFVLRLHWGIVWLKAWRSYGSFALSPSHHNSSVEHSVQLSCLCQDFYGSLASFSTSSPFLHNHSVFLSSNNNNKNGRTMPQRAVRDLTGVNWN